MPAGPYLFVNHNAVGLRIPLGQPVSEGRWVGPVAGNAAAPFVTFIVICCDLNVVERMTISKTMLPT